MDTIERRGGYRGGPKAGNYAWARAGKVKGHGWVGNIPKYTYPEQVARDKYLASYDARVNALRGVILESGARYAEQDNPFSSELFPLNPEPAIYRVLPDVKARNYVPNYPDRYKSY